MAWFRNSFRCGQCHTEWHSCWSCVADDDCPACGARHITPFSSDELSDLIVETEGGFKLLRSPSTAEQFPCYAEIGTFATRELAQLHLDGLLDEDV